jgi:diguanylate cyclase (GGDEF)-like protein
MPAARLQLLTVLVAAGAAVLLATVAPHWRPFVVPFDLPWWMLACAFAAAEAGAVRLAFRRDSYTFTLRELPLVAGLVFVSPLALLSARLVGSLVVLAARRTKPARLAWTTALYAFETAVAVAIMSAVAASTPFEPYGLVGIFGATLVTSATGVLLAIGAISLSEGRVSAFRIGDAVVVGATVTAANTSIAIVATHELWTRSTLAGLLLVPAGVILVAYRAYMAERDKHSRLKFLHETSRAITRSREFESGMHAVLEQVRTAFRADIGEIILASSRSGPAALRTVVGPGAQSSALEPFELDPTSPAASTIADRIPRLLTAGELRGHPLVEKLNDAIIVPLIDEADVLGTLLVANRLDATGSFTGDDVRLLETLSYHVAASLENERLGRTLGQLEELKQTLEYQAFHDPLTGLANRARFQERVREALEGADSGNAHAVLYLDLDDFKTINDSLGHDAGDHLLCVVAERLRRVVRPSDLAARLGGDEFAILIVNNMDAALPPTLALRIIEVLQEPIQLAETSARIGTSVGIAWTTPGISSEELLRNADIAMYRAKHEGTSVAIFEGRMHAETLDRMSLRADLEGAMSRDELILHYQPVVQLSTGHVVAFEALARWNHPERGQLLPADFISLAEQSGLIVPIGRSLLAHACAQTREWHVQAGESELSVAVNVSGRQVKDRDFLDGIMGALRFASLEARHLIIEITESVLMHEDEDIVSRLQTLRALGVRIAIDDFGSGYSSLGYLQRFPIDIVKLPKQFVDQVATDSGAALARAILQLAHALGITAIAEGIETDVQRARLELLGYAYGQGHLYASARDASLSACMHRIGTPGTRAAALGLRQKTPVRIRDASAA